MQLDNACQNALVSYHDFRLWITQTLQDIQEKKFAFYMVIGPSIENKEQKLDVFLHIKNMVYVFTEYSDSKKFGGYSLTNLAGYFEDIEKGKITVNLIFPEGFRIFIEDYVENTKKLRDFTKNILTFITG